MRLIRSTLLSVCLLFAVDIVVKAKEWRGIIPLQSTRTDVTRLFGTCTESDQNNCIYDLEREKVIFLFLPQSCKACDKPLVEDTVTRIHLIPKIDTQLTDYSLDVDSIVMFQTSTETGLHEVFVDDEEGIAIESEKGRIVHVYYLPAARDITLCPSAYVKPSDLFAKKRLIELVCPIVSINCPNEDIAPGQPITVTANISGGLPLEPAYTWSISQGSIISGQNTPSITIDTAGLPDNTDINVKLVVGGYQRNCPRIDSCTSRIRLQRD
jgi:hypothetical protein